jgi:TRAP-type mannitol/chloroaromatic compound transport system substrate-binding protein
MQFPPDMMDALRKMAMEVLEEEAAKDAMSKKVHEAFKTFKKRVGVWGTVADEAYFKVIADKYALKV